MINARAAYQNNSVQTASPQKLLVMLYDRLVLDLKRAEEATRCGDQDEASRQLQHAQDIVAELRSTLRMDAWEGSESLAAIYDFLQVSLVKANVGRDADLVASCQALVAPLADAWREAALAVTSGAGLSTAS
jgi:flagellar protein FliS